MNTATLGDTRPDTMRAATRSIAEKAQRLREIADELKGEFFGIDDQIDELARMLTPYYATPHLLKKPLIINIWGMTGTGKTDLVQKFIKRMGVDHRSAYIDIGEFSGSFSDYDLREKLTELAKEADGEPVMVIFDEMQIARTIDENGREVSNNVARVLWELLDSGRVTERSFVWHSYNVKVWVRRLKAAVTGGLEVKNNIIVKGHSLLEQYTGDSSKEEGPGTPAASNETASAKSAFETTDWFLRPDKVSSLLQMAPMYFTDTIGDTERAIQSAVAELGMYGSYLALEREWFTNHFCRSEHFASSESTIAWLEGLMGHLKLQRTFDFNPCVIINMGNLDEVYTASGGNDPDVDIEMLEEVAAEVSLTSIKQALLKRFRPEQIARLGHNHIIYPSLSEDAYRKIITRELHARYSDTLDHCGIELLFDKSVNDIIYRETVFPTQGARCVLTGMSAMMDSYIPWFLFEAQLANTDYCRVRFNFEKSQYELELPAGVKEYRVELKVENVRRAEPDDKVAQVAVHEAAHAVVGAVLTGKTPRMIHVHGASGTKGYVVHETSDVMSVEEALHMATQGLAGSLAEEMVFGMKPTSDLLDNAQATSVISQLVRVHMYETPHRVYLMKFTDLSSPMPSNAEWNHDVDCVVGRIMDQCEATARELVGKHLKAIVALANELKTRGKMAKDDIGPFLAPFGITARDGFSYLDALNSKHEELNG